MKIRNLICDNIIFYKKRENNKINKKIEEFALKMAEKGQSAQYYIQKRNARADKVLCDIKLGKKAEFFARDFLNQQFGVPLLVPDLTIREKRNKKWEKDLTCGNIEFDVKSCSQKTLEICRDYSWTFQHSNNDNGGGKDEIFKIGGFVILVYLESFESSTASIKGIVNWQDLRKYLKDPITPFLKGIKKCIYYQDLLKNKIEIEK